MDLVSLRPEAVARFRELAGAVGPAGSLPIASRRLPVVEARAWVGKPLVLCTIGSMGNHVRT